MTTTQERFARWLSNVDEGERARLEALSDGEREDAFFQELAFGTAGLRGVLGLGSNRMNVYTVAKATQGLADYLNAQGADAHDAAHDGAHDAAHDAPLVVVCRDSRHGGEEFVHTIAGVLAANGVRCALYPRVEPTPALSFAVRHLHADAGINVTASHNPAAYNGYKVYGADGCQIKTGQARAIQQAIDALDAFSDVKSMPFEEALDEGLATWMDEEVLEAFVNAVAAQSLEPLAGEALHTRLPVLTETISAEMGDILRRRYEVIDNQVPDDIAGAAAEIAGGASGDEEKARLLYDWVGSRIVYDYDKADNYIQRGIWKEQTPQDTFDSRLGVCIDYARLYAVMARSQGLEVRVVTGLGYDGRGGYGSHAWNEVFVGEREAWIPLDPTWAGSGNWFNPPDFDETHIKETVL